MNITEREIDLIEKAAKRAGMVSILNHGAASCVYSEGCNGVTQEHLMAFAREIALHCATALYQPNLEDAQGEIRALRATEAGLVERVKELEDGLRFYADPGDYKSPFTGGLGKLYFDCGLAARALLEKKE